MSSGPLPPDDPLGAPVDGEEFEAVAEELIDEQAAQPEASTALVPVSRERLPVSIDPLARYIQQVRQAEELDPGVEQELARQYRDRGDTEAARRLITANLRLVVKLALMYRRAFRNVWDLIQEGNIGLMEALKRYDPEQKVRFSTYAAWWIKAYMLKYLLDNHRLVRVGTTNARRKLLYNLRKEQRKLAAEGIQATPKLLAERFGVSEEDVVEVDKALSSRDVSVDAPLGEDSRRTFAEVLPAEQVSVEEQVSVAELREKVDRALEAFKKTVGPRDRALIELRLAADEPVTLQELGNRFGVTREAMRQAENKLKKKLAVYLREQLGEDVSL